MCIGDVHGRTFWKNAVRQEFDNVDKVIFLGDYVDPYPWENITRMDAIRNFEEIVDFASNNKDKVVLLWGNHDTPYVYKRDFYTRVRYDSSHAHKIGEIFRSHMSLFKLAHEENINDKQYLFTHSGLLYEWYENHKDLIGDLTVDNLNRLIKTQPGRKALCEISFYRGGYDEWPSILWGDLHEFGEIIQADKSINENIPWDYQVLGHTQLKDKPVIEKEFACLDCRKAFIIESNGDIKKIEESKNN